MVRHSRARVGWWLWAVLLSLGFGFGGCAGGGRSALEEGKTDPGRRSVQVGWLGIEVQDIPQRIADYYSLGSTDGAVVTTVSPESPGKRAGLEWGDLILAVEDVALTSPDDLAEWSGVLDRDRVTLGIVRAGSRGKVEVVLRPAAEAPEKAGDPTEPSEEADLPAAEDSPAGEEREQAEKSEAEKKPQATTESAEETESRLAERAYRQLAEGQLQNALQSYRELVKQKEEDPQVHNNLGAVLNLLGEPKEALEHFDKSISMEPGFAQAHYNRGLALWSLGHHEEALVSYRNAASLVPNLMEARLAEADALLQLGRLPEAREANRRGLEFDPGNVPLLHQKGDILRAQGEHEEAAASYREALALEPGNRELLLALGISLDEDGEHREAWNVYDRLVEAGGGATAYHNRALARWRAGDSEGALADEEKAVGLEPNFPSAHATRAKILASQGRALEAMKAWGEVLAIQPGSGAAIEGLDRIGRRFFTTAEGVRRAQGWLKRNGEDPGEIDGLLGPSTRKALRRFQRKNGLAVNGELTGLTLLRLAEGADSN